MKLSSLKVSWQNFHKFHRCEISKKNCGYFYGYVKNKLAVKGNVTSCSKLRMFNVAQLAAGCGFLLLKQATLLRRQVAHSVQTCNLLPATSCMSGRGFKQLRNSLVDRYSRYSVHDTRRNYQLNWFNAYIAWISRTRVIRSDTVQPDVCSDPTEHVKHWMCWANEINSNYTKKERSHSWSKESTCLLMGKEKTMIKRKWL